MLNYSKDILLKQSLSGTIINSYAPFTLSINPSAIDGITKKVYKIDYIFSNEDVVYQTWFYKVSEQNTLPYRYDMGDPRNFSQQHTFYLPNILKKEYEITCRVHQIGISNPITIPFTLSLSAPKMDGSATATFSSLHLVQTRMFGLENNILYVFESEDPRYYIPVIFNWKTRPIPPEIILIDEGYRPYRIFEPYEDQRLSNAYQHIEMYNEQGSYEQGGYPTPPPLPPPSSIYLAAGNSFNDVRDILTDQFGRRIITN